MSSSGISMGRRGFPQLPTNLGKPSASGLADGADDFSTLDEFHRYLIDTSCSMVREALGFNTPPQLPLPRLVTHIDLHLDEFWGILLLRVAHKSPSHTEFVVEIAQRDEDLSLILHPEIRNAILLGIAPFNLTPSHPFIASYDEHTRTSKRLAASASRLVIQRLIEGDVNNYEVISDIAEEVDEIDSKGDQKGGRTHIGSLIKGLHHTNTLIQGQLGRVTTGFKEAVILSCLAASITYPSDWDSRTILDSWGRYISDAPLVFSDSLTTEAIEGSPASIERDKNDGIAYLITHPRDTERILNIYSIAESLYQSLPLSHADYIMHALFESLVQMQRDFLASYYRTDLPSVNRGRLAFEHIVLAYEDKLPDRGRLAYYNQRKTPAILVVHNPYAQTTTIKKNTFVSNGRWRDFIASLIDKEPGCWFELGPFVLNGTRTHLHVPPTSLEFEDIVRLWK